MAKRKNPKQSPAIQIEVDGTTYTVRPDEVSGLDASACRRATGFSVAGLFRAANEDPDLDVIAALVWLARRQDGEGDLAFAEVAKAISYSSDIETAQNDGDGEGDDEGEVPAAD